MNRMDRDPSLINLRYWFFFIFGIILFFVGLGIAWDAYITHRTIVSSSTWPSTTGNVTTTGIKVQNHKESGPGYYPIVTYHYYVAEVEYACNIRLLERSSNEDAAAVLKSLPIGTNIKIAYNPETPEGCVSEYDEYVSQTLPVGIIVIGIIVVIIIFIQVRKKLL